MILLQREEVNTVDINNPQYKKDYVDVWEMGERKTYFLMCIFSSYLFNLTTYEYITYYK